MYKIASRRFRPNLSTMQPGKTNDLSKIDRKGLRYLFPLLRKIDVECDFCGGINDITKILKNEYLKSCRYNNRKTLSVFLINYAREFTCSKCKNDKMCIFHIYMTNGNKFIDRKNIGRVPRQGYDQEQKTKTVGTHEASISKLTTSYETKETEDSAITAVKIAFEKAKSRSG
jgi:hypothetical protein